MNNGHLIWQTFCSNILSAVDESPVSPLHIDDNTAFINYLKANGIVCILLDALENQNKTVLLPQSILIKLQSFRRIESVNELYTKQSLHNIITLLSHNQIDCLILKGSALAYSLYNQPYHRVRGDTDILIRPHDKNAVDALLAENGYQKYNAVSGKLISHQDTYLITENDISHYYDIHWKISNRNAFAGLFEFDELHRSREKMTMLGESAYRLSNIDAILHAIVHYYGHFPDDRERLIWIYDLHLLCSQIKSSEWKTFLQKSAAKKLDPLVTQALLLCQKTFKTQLPAQVLQQLEQSPVKLSKIEQQRLSASHWSRIAQFKSDWAVLSFKQRCLLIKEYMLPPSDFILKQNQSNNKLLLPYFYCKRLLLGGIKVIKDTLTQ